MARGTIIFSVFAIILFLIFGDIKGVSPEPLQAGTDDDTYVYH